MSEDLSRNEQRLAMFDQMIAKGSDDPFVFYGRAMELRSLGRLEDALVAYGELGERFPEYIPTYLMAGQVCEELGRPEDARAWYDRGLEASAGKDAHAHSELQMARDSLD